MIDLGGIFEQCACPRSLDQNSQRGLCSGQKMQRMFVTYRISHPKLLKEIFFLKKLIIKIGQIEHYKI